jgi:hypothetical protein
VTSSALRGWAAAYANTPGSGLVAARDMYRGCENRFAVRHRSFTPVSFALRKRSRSNSTATTMKLPAKVPCVIVPNVRVVDSIDDSR